MVDGTPIDRQKLLSIGVISRQTRAAVRDGRADDGTRSKAVTDELGNTVTEHSGPDASGVSNRQDVLIRPKHLQVSLSSREIPNE